LVKFRFSPDASAEKEGVGIKDMALNDYEDTQQLVKEIFRF
jgi:hypothetical protein